MKLNKICLIRLLKGVEVMKVEGVSHKFSLVKVIGAIGESLSC